MGKINTDNYPNRPVSDYQDDDMFILQDNGGETYTTNIGDIKDLIGEETDPKLALKVDKNGTDRLMTADEGTKLAGIAAGAQVNVLEGVVVDTIEQPISGKKAFINLSGKANLSVIAYEFREPEEGQPQMAYFKGAYVTYNGKLYEFTEEHRGAWNPSHVREIKATDIFVRAGNGGYNTGNGSTTEGSWTRAEGEAAHAEGYQTIANSDYQHAEGKYNVADNENKYIHIVGNGIDDNNRSNALTLDWDGNLAVSGEVEDGNGEKISDKADKVTNATSGHLAGLDSNGNLTDSGVSPTEDVTVEGNPVTFESPFEQDAKSVVVTVKPIQDLHGYDHPWPAGGGKNFLGIQDGVAVSNGITFTPIKDNADNIIGITLNGTATDNVDFWRFLGIDLAAGTERYITLGVENEIPGLQLVISPTWSGMNPSKVTTDAIQGVYIGIWQGAVFDNVNIYPMICLNSETDKSFAPYSNICPISGIDEVEIEVSDGESELTTTTIPLPSTLYGGTVDVDTGVVTVTDGYIASYDGETLPGEWISDRDEYVAGTSPTTGAEVAYKLATPTTISFTPADVELIEGTNVVSTNAEKVAVKYGRSLWQDIDDLKTNIDGKLNKSDVADIEGDTASRAYSVNEFMLRSDGFYKVTQPIAQNASITASNTTKTTIGAVLTALLNA